MYRNKVFARMMFVLYWRLQAAFYDGKLSNLFLVRLLLWLLSEYPPREAIRRFWLEVLEEREFSRK